MLCVCLETFCCRGPNGSLEKGGGRDHVWHMRMADMVYGYDWSRVGPLDANMATTTCQVCAQDQYLSSQCQCSFPPSFDPFLRPFLLLLHRPCKRDPALRISTSDPLTLPSRTEIVHDDTIRLLYCRSHFWIYVTTSTHSRHSTKVWGNKSLDRSERIRTHLRYTHIPFDSTINLISTLRLSRMYVRKVDSRLFHWLLLVYAIIPCQLRCCGVADT